MREPLRLTSITGVGESRFRVEVVDDDVLVLDVVERLIHRIPGSEVDELLAGRPTRSLTHLPEQSLTAVRAALSSSAVARRRVLMSGGVLAASGIVTFGLPFAIAAASPVLSLAGGETEYRAIVGSSPTTESLDVAAISGGSVQVLLRATKGGDGAAAQNARGGEGAYLAATISDIPATGTLFFRAGAGGDAGEVRYPSFDVGYRGGRGGTAVAVSFSPPGIPTTYTFLAVAGAGGGAGGGQDGGAFGQAGGGDRGGGAGTASAVGAAGASSANVAAPAREGGAPVNGYPGHRLTLFIGDTVGGDGEVPSEVSRPFGGGGGAGYYQGGGGASASASGLTDGGGGGGGSTYFGTAVASGTPRVTSSQVFPSGNPLATGADVTVYYTQS